ncbi:MAG: hypothetical protein HKN47_02185 [Pirellulaceae bacterium]|nr:hypothetical protein [Pirellulaceae bacterium]
MIAPVQPHDTRTRPDRRVAIDETWEYDTTAPAEPSTLDSIRNVIGTHPAAAIASAAVVGLLTAWLVKRRGH